MSFKHCIPSMIAIVSVCLAGCAPAHSAHAATKEVPYSWCTQGSTLHCYYMNREQCEETVDYHGFCVANPDYRQGHARSTSAMIFSPQMTPAASACTAHKGAGERVENTCASS